MKTSELVGPQLDWAVAECEGVSLESFMSAQDFVEHAYQYSTTWSQGGPIVEREYIQVNVKRLIGTSESGAEVDVPDGWQAHKSSRYWMSPKVFYGPTPLIAAMRAFVASKLGDEIELPEELK